MIAGSLEIQLLTNLARLQSDMNQAKGVVGGAMRSISDAVGVAKTALGALGVGLSVNYFAGLIKGSIDAQDHINDLTKSTKLSVETLAGLQLAAKQSGGDLDSIAASVTKLSVEMGKAPDKFRALGISAKDPLEAFKQLADIMNAIEDPQQRNAVAAAALGKSWAGAAPLLAEGSAQIQEMVDKGTRLSGVTKESAENADRFNDKMAELKTSAGKLATSITNELLPPLTKVLDILIKGGAEKVEVSWFDKWFTNSTLKVKEYIASIETATATTLRFFGADKLAAVHDAEAKRLRSDIDGTRAAQLAREIAQYRSGERVTGAGAGGAAAAAAAAAKARAFLGTGSGAAAPAAPTFEMDAAKRYALIEADRLRLAQEGAELSVYITKGIRDDIDARTKLNDTLEAEAENYRNLIDPARRYQQEIERVNDLVKSGKLSADEGSAAVQKLYQESLKTFGTVAHAGVESSDEIVRAIKGFGDASARAFAKMSIDGRASFDDIRQAANKLLEDILAMQYQKRLTDPLVKAGSGILDKVIEGGVGALFGTTGAAASDSAQFGIEAPSIWQSLFGTKFANGGSFTVPGSGGVDTTPVSFMATPGETVDVRTPSQQGGGAPQVTVNPTFNVVVPDTISFAKWLGTRESRQMITGVFNEAMRTAGRLTRIPTGG